MLLMHDPDRTVPTFTKTTCEYHKRNPRGQWAGCYCSASFGQREATQEEYQANRKKRLEKERQELQERLAEVEAELIR